MKIELRFRTMYESMTLPKSLKLWFSWESMENESILFCSSGKMTQGSFHSPEFPGSSGSEWLELPVGAFNDNTVKNSPNHFLETTEVDALSSYTFTRY